MSKMSIMTVAGIVAKCIISYKTQCSFLFPTRDLQRCRKTQQACFKSHPNSYLKNLCSDTHSAVAYTHYTNILNISEQVCIVSSYQMIPVWQIHQSM